MDPAKVAALVAAIEQKDLSTAAHTWRVVLYTRVLCEHFDLDHDTIARATIGAAMHDVGKLDIPDGILQKPAKLTEQEFDVIKTHPALGHARLTVMGETDPLVLELVRHHHERFDGAGYPDKLAGALISPAARYFAVVDTFDALTSVRPYRHEVGPEAARAAITELRDSVGSRYCADCVNAFAGLYERGKLDWILENFNDRCELPKFDGPARASEATRKHRPA